MFDLLGYSPADLMMFSRETYYRLLERYNSDVWPLQIAALLLGAAIIGLVWYPSPARSRAAAAILAAIWFWVAYAFHFERYATVHIAAPLFAALFVLEGMLLLWSGAAFGQIKFAPAQDMPSWAGLGLVIFALLFQPLTGWLAGRTWGQAEAFALMPDPTAVATFGFLLMTPSRTHWALLIIPILWSAISGVTAWPLGVYENLVTPVAGALTLVFAAWKALRHSA